MADFKKFTTISKKVKLSCGEVEVFPFTLGNQTEFFELIADGVNQFNSKKDDKDLNKLLVNIITSKIKDIIPLALRCDYSDIKDALIIGDTVSIVEAIIEVNDLINAVKKILDLVTKATDQVGKLDLLKTQKKS